jgi:hypothetical protein
VVSAAPAREALVVLLLVDKVGRVVVHVPVAVSVVRHST